MLAPAWPALACVGWKTAKRFPPCLVSARVSVHDAALSSARPTGCALHGASLFFARAKKSKQKKARPFIRVRELRPRTSLLPPALRGPAYKGHPWPFTPLAASMPLVPLRAGSTRPSARGRVVSPVGPCMEKQSEASHCSFRQLGPKSPSGGRTQALRRGTRGMDAERGTKGQGRPFVTCPRSDAGVREVWSHSDQTRMQGAPSLWLLSLGETRESDAPCEAQPVATATESAASDTNVRAPIGGKCFAVFHPTFLPVQARKSETPCKAQPVARAEESAASDTNLHATGGGKRCAVFHPTALGQTNAQKAPPAPSTTPACRLPRHPGPYQTPTAKVPQC